VGDKNKKMARKRERLDVIKDILNAIKDNRNIKPTRLLYSSNLSPQMFKDYINELITKSFIRLDIDEKEKKSFSLTTKGYEFLEEYKVIENFVENFGL
jgi:predicted transcriptional regulator